MWHSTDTHKRPALPLLNLTLCALIQKSFHKSLLPIMCTVLYLCSTKIFQPAAGFIPMRNAVNDTAAPPGWMCGSHLSALGLWWQSQLEHRRKEESSMGCCEDGVGVYPKGAIMVLIYTLEEWKNNNSGETVVMGKG